MYFLIICFKKYRPSTVFNNEENIDTSNKSSPHKTKLETFKPKIATDNQNVIPRDYRKFTQNYNSTKRHNYWKSIFHYICKCFRFI